MNRTFNLSVEAIEVLQTKDNKSSYINELILRDKAIMSDKVTPETLNIVFNMLKSIEDHIVNYRRDV